MKKQGFLTAVLSYGLIFVCGTLSAQTWENEMLLGKVKSYTEKLTHYQNGENTPFLVERCEYIRYKEFNEQGKIIKYRGKSSNASVNNSVHSYYSKDRIEGRAKYWTFTEDYDILSGFVRNVTDPLAYMSDR